MLSPQRSQSRPQLQPMLWPQGLGFSFISPNKESNNNQWQKTYSLAKYATSVQFSSVTQSCPTLLIPWTAGRQASLSITNCRSLPEPMSIESLSILGTYWPGEFIFQCHIFLPFHTLHRVLKARILKWSIHQFPEFTQTHVCWVGDAIQPSHLLSSPSPVFSLSQHQGLFQWVCSLHQAAKVLEFQLQCSFQWALRTDFL